ncbi:MAG: hypothetical protein ACK56W_20450, partial [Pirellula sp.]
MASFARESERGLNRLLNALTSTAQFIVRSRERTRIETSRKAWNCAICFIVRSRERTRIETSLVYLRRLLHLIVRSRERTRIETA